MAPEMLSGGRLGDTSGVVDITHGMLDLENCCICGSEHDNMTNSAILETLSPSRASDFKTCPQLFKFRHIDKIPSPPTAAQTRGLAIHSALEDLFDLEAPQRGREQLLRLVAEACEKTLAEDSFTDLFAGDIEGRDKFMREALETANRYFQLEDPRFIEPLDRERWVKLDITDASRPEVPIEVRGVVDRIDPRGDGTARIVDYKTGNAPPVQYADSAFFALKIYALIISESTGWTPSQIRLLYLGNAISHTLPVSEGQLRAIKRQILALRSAIERGIAGDIFPTRVSRLCDWCYYQSICPAFSGSPV